MKQVYKDIIMHVIATAIGSFLCSTVLAHTTPIATPAVFGGFLCGISAGIGKEFGDCRATGNTWSWTDLLADAVGSAIGCWGGLVSWLIFI